MSLNELFGLNPSTKHGQGFEQLQLEDRWWMEYEDLKDSERANWQAEIPQKIS